MNVQMAGVRTPRPSTKQGEPPEQWGEEVKRIYARVSLYRSLMHDILGVGQVLYRVEATSTTRSSYASIPTPIDRHAIPSRCIKHPSPSNVPDREWYVLSISFLPELLFTTSDPRQSSTLWETSLNTLSRLVSLVSSTGTQVCLLVRVVWSVSAPLRRSPRRGNCACTRTYRRLLWPRRQTGIQRGDLRGTLKQR